MDYLLGNVLLRVNLPACLYLWTNTLNSFLLDISGLLIWIFRNLSSMVDDETYKAI